MTIDMSQFRKTFLEESFEGLEIIENTLLNIDPETADNEQVNAIFRAAHSIKGGSATFGFEELTDLTHLAETLLDQIRNNERKLTHEIIELFLQSVDCLRHMLQAYQHDEKPETTMAHQLEKSLNKVLGTNDDLKESSSSDTEEKEPEKTKPKGWLIEFIPNEGLFLTGNDPLRIIRELNDLGKLDQVEAHLDNLPDFAHLNPENCYLSWTIHLAGEITKEDIDEVFEWVIDDCEVDLTLLDAITESLEQERITAMATEQHELGQSGDPSTNQAKGQAQAASIRVDIEKIDALLNMVGELVITQSMLCQIGDNFSLDKLIKLQEGLGLLAQNTRELQESVMKVRMVPISFIFNRVPRMVFDLTKKLNKKVSLQISGEQTELDKTVMEKLSDPLTHLVRNSLDHGIEIPETRIAAGKPEEGILQLNAYHQGGNIVIEIVDDGAGINKDKVLKKAIENGLATEDQHLSDSHIYDLIFQPGFSTADAISDVSGRGVGMDVVRKNIESLGGKVDIVSQEGKGSTFSIQLPLTLSILDGQLIKIGDQVYIIPLVSIIESIQIEKECLETIKGTSELYKLRNDYIPIAKMYQIFSIPNAKTDLLDGLLVVVEANGQKLGLLVDELLAQQQVVIKSLETNYKRVEGVSGATILGDGTVALILDSAGLLEIVREDAVSPSTDNKASNRRAAA